ncbi:hypothetical protein BKA69DRAFT_1053742 [Paraphysoderma sedebokerense]|nr:hypothetical protein BKA69DRAFT_1053742 [Paraphysoderma sedebokerense]
MIWSTPSTPYLFLSFLTIASIFILFSSNNKPAPYPINLLRNIAMSNSRTDMVLNLDVDFIVSDGLYERLKMDEKYRRKSIHS